MIHFFFVPVQGTAGGIGGPGNCARNFAIVSLGFSAASFVGPTIAGFSIVATAGLSACWRPSPR